MPNPGKPCEIDDVICQLQLLEKLKSVKEILGTPEFNTEFPEAVALGQRVEEKISQQTTAVKESIESCGRAYLEQAEREPLQPLSGPSEYEVSQAIAEQEEDD